MPVKDKYMVKCVLGDSDLELSADSGEAFLVKDIQIFNPASNYITVTIDKVTVGYFRVGGQLGSHLPFLKAQAKHAHDIAVAAGADTTTSKRCDIKNAGGTDLNFGLIHDGTSSAQTLKRAMDLESIATPRKTILGLLAALGIFKGYPVASGQKFKISGAKQSGAIQLVVYERWDEEDIKKDMPNGTDAKEYMFLNYGNCGGNVNADGNTLYNTPKSPAQFPDFPFGKVVDPKKKITIHGILASDFAPAENDGTNYCYTKYLKLIQGRKTLFDEDMNGILLYAPFTEAYGDIDMVGEGYSLIGNFSDVDMKEPLIFPEPLEFPAGEELNIYLTTVKGGTGQNIAIAEHEIALIETVTIEE